MNVYRLFVPLQRAEGEDRTVTGYCWRNAEADDGFILTREVMERMTADYLKFANLREMHGKSAAGTTSVEWDEHGALMRAVIVDDEAWKKVEAGVYKGFSVGVKPKRVKRVAGKTEILDGTWYETSLVDRPADPDAVFQLARAEGASDEDTCDVEVEEEAQAERGMFKDLITDPARMCRAALSVLEDCIWNIRYDDKLVDKESAVREAASEFANWLAPNISRMERVDLPDEALERIQGQVTTLTVDLEVSRAEISQRDADIERLKAENDGLLKRLKTEPDPAQQKPFKVTDVKFLQRISGASSEELDAKEKAKVEMDDLIRKDWTSATDAEKSAAMTRIEELKRVL